MNPNEIHKMDAECESTPIPAKCHFCAEELDVEKFLSVNGPEEAYALAKKVMDAALEDLKAGWMESDCFD